MKNSINVLVLRNKALEGRLNSIQSIKKALLIGAFFYVFFITAHPVNANECPPSKIHETAQIDYVHDGDTVKLKDGRKVRLIGINSPEVSHKNQPAQSFAYPARNALRAMIKQANQKVGLSYGLQRYDKYKRTLAHLYLADGTNVQAQLIKQGYATAFTTPPNDRLSDCYKKLEASIISQQKGIWSRSEYAVKQAQQLNKMDQGFRRIQGVVKSVQSTKKAFWIHLPNNLRIRIAQQDLYNFNLYSLQQLSNKNIRVRGWLHADNKTYFMMLRHPSALSLAIK